MSEIEFWKIIATVLAIVFFWLLKTGLKKLTDKMDELILATRENNADIRLLKDKVDTHEVRLNDHSKSIRELERKVKE